MHLGGKGAQGINSVTLPALDPVSRQPELKHCAVRIEKADLSWRLVAFAYAADADALALAQAAREHFGSFPHATCVLVGREREGVLFRAAAACAPDPSLIDAIDTLFGVNVDRTLRYDDARRAISRRIQVANGRIEAVRLAGDVTAEPWLRDLFERQETVANLGALLLAPSLYRSGAARGKVVCSCWNVSENEITRFMSLQAGDGDLAALKSELKCGTQCGSCVPELKRLIAAAKAAA